jgi:Domain of unknown function (DUF4340)
MNQKKFLALTVTTVVVLAAGVWISMHRSSEQSDLGGSAMFADLKPALGEVSEVRFAKGDGSRTTLRKSADGWMVVERQYPADASRVRELVLNLASLKVVERKTKDPANYARLGVEAPDSPTAGSTLVEVVAGKKTWSLIVGKSADGRAIYVRKPAEAVSLLAAPSITVDPDQKRWIDRLLVDVPGANVHDVSVKLSSNTAYVLTRAARGAQDLSVSPIPKGRKAATTMSLGSQTEALTGFHFDDVRTAPSPPSGGTDAATYRTFDGQVIEFTGHREADKAFVTVTTRRDPELAAKFPEAPATSAAKPAATPEAATPPSGMAADQTAEKLGARAKGMEFEIPVYKYEAIFRKPEELLEKLPESAKK